MKNERGYALFIVLGVIIFIGIIGASLLTLSSQSLKISAKEQVNQSAFYIAEAGVNIKQARLNHLIKNAYSSAQHDPEHFDTTFTQLLKTILKSEQVSTYDSSHFNETINGEPTATVTIEFLEDNPHKFKIVSNGSFDNKNTRSVEKEFSIPSQLYSSIPSTEKEDNNKVPDAEDGIIPVKPKAEVYITDYLSLVSSQAHLINAHFYHAKKESAIYSVISSFNPNNTRQMKQKVTYNYKMTIPQFSHGLSSSELGDTPSKNLNNTTDLQNMGSKMGIPTLKNFSNHTFNLKIQSGKNNLYFKKSLLHYNLSSTTFNVEGSGTLNIIFDELFHLDAGRSFIVNAPNATVNLIFRKGANIFGTLQAQNIYAQEKDLYVPAFGKIQAETIVVLKNDLRNDANGQITAKTILALNGYTRIDGITNVQKIYAKRLYSTLGSRLNVDQKEEKEQIEEINKPSKDYVFIDDSKLISSTPLKEINNP